MSETEYDPVTATCDREVFAKGLGICTFAASSRVTEAWVVKVRELSSQRVDWHYSGGRVNMLYIGDYQKVKDAIEQLLPELSSACQEDYKARYGKTPSFPVPEAYVLFPPNSHGLYRQGDELPPDVLGVSS